MLNRRMKFLLVILLILFGGRIAFYQWQLVQESKTGWNKDIPHAVHRLSPDGQRFEGQGQLDAAALHPVGSVTKVIMAAFLFESGLDLTLGLCHFVVESCSYPVGEKTLLELMRHEAGVENITEDVGDEEFLRIVLPRPLNRVYGYTNAGYRLLEIAVKRHYKGESWALVQGFMAKRGVTRMERIENRTLPFKLCFPGSCVDLERGFGVQFRGAGDFMLVGRELTTLLLSFFDDKVLWGQLLEHIFKTEPSKTAFFQGYVPPFKTIIAITPDGTVTAYSQHDAFDTWVLTRIAAQILGRN